MPASHIIGVSALVAGLLASSAGPASSSAQVTRGDFAPLSSAGETIEGHASMIRTGDGRTKVSAQVSGLEPGNTYASHVHTGTCAQLLGHYQQVVGGGSTPPNELWVSSDPKDPQAGLTASASGNASGHGTAPWTAREEARSVVIHATPTGGPRLACADLT